RGHTMRSLRMRSFRLSSTPSPNMAFPSTLAFRRRISFSTRATKCDAPFADSETATRHGATDIVSCVGPPADLPHREARGHVDDDVDDHAVDRGAARRDADEAEAGEPTAADLVGQPDAFVVGHGDGLD